MWIDSCDMINITSSWPYGDQWAPIHYCLIEESKGENELFLFTQDLVKLRVVSLCHLIVCHAIYKFPSVGLVPLYYFYYYFCYYYFSRRLSGGNIALNKKNQH